MIDVRFGITQSDIDNVKKNFFDELGRLKLIPAREKKKIVVLHIIKDLFESKVDYSEKDINDKLSEVNVDFATLRRYLVDYGFLKRDKDCGKYWVERKEG